ncbi:hypothetical protein H8356DRAFT_1631042, partial [Neocallimastix lanati (nom. inval.)]
MNLFCVLLYIYFLIITVLYQHVNGSLNDNLLNFTLITYDENYELTGRHEYTYNYTTHLFNEFNQMKELQNIKSSILCNSQDIDKNEDEKKTILFWNTYFTNNLFNSSAIYYSAFCEWANEQRNKGNLFCLRIDTVTWVENVNDIICKDETTPCPDLIILGTTQFSYRYNNGETLDLTKYFRKYFKKTGNSVDSLINKNSFYDYHIGNDWLAVPLITDFRNFRFNISTFDYCIRQGFDLHYPPPLSDYWGINYKETWTWEKVFEYAKLITNCTGLPGFRLYDNNDYEDLKFFTTLCQSLDIPFIIDDIDLDIKKCGFRKKEYIQKLSIFKELFENHYIEKWLYEDDIIEWQNKPYPSNIEEQPIFKIHYTGVYDNDTYINGMIYDVPIDKEYPDIKYSYMPGYSTFLGGSGLIITKATKYPDQLFEYIENLINQDYPYFSELNAFKTPFENVDGKRCSKIKISKKDNCISLLNLNGTYPYYYSYNNNLNIIYISHISKESNRGIFLNTKSNLNSGLYNNIFQNVEFECDNEADYTKKTITYSSEYRIEVPINENEIIILKAMTDIAVNKQTNEAICSIFDDTLQIAKPYQFPYSTFSGLSKFESKAPISLLFAHLYYKYNETERTFEENINECCDIIDYELLPDCSDKKDIKFNLSSCIEHSNIMEISYLNCRKENNDINFENYVQCTYIPLYNIRGIIMLCIGSFSIIIEISFMVFIYLNRTKKCILRGGLIFLICLVVSSTILGISSLFRVGKIKSFKCVLEFWTMIIGITGNISCYSIKSKIIISIFNNKDLIKINYKYKSFLEHIFIGILQLVLLTFWTLTQNGVEMKKKYLKNKSIYYEYQQCSMGNEYIFSLIFFVDYILLLLSIYVAYQGRNIPDEFNESKKVFISSLISFGMLILCHISKVTDFEKLEVYVIITVIIVIATLAINVTFISSLIFSIFHVEPARSSVLVISKQNVINDLGMKDSIN